MDSHFTLGDRHDVEDLRNAFSHRGRIEIRDFLAPQSAEALRSHLITRGDWKLVLNAGASVYEIPRAGLAQMTEPQRRELDERVAKAAREGFQYRYESIRVPDDAARQADTTMLADFVRFMSSRPVLDLLQDITGAHDFLFADGQATAYSAGHFLTRHDDAVADKNRRAAYVLGLTPSWRAEWGGLLMFHRDDDNIGEAFVPAMGALRLFSVPSVHSVSYVTPFAPEPRISVTGWLRSQLP